MSIRKIDGVVVDADTVDTKHAGNAADKVPVLDAAARLPSAQTPRSVLTTPVFRAIPGKGTANVPASINDNDTTTITAFIEVGRYIVVILPGVFHISQWRQFGNTSNTGNGRYLLEYLDEAGAWQEWQTAVPVRTTADWSNWDSTPAEVTAIGIRITCSVEDTYGQNNLAELEVKY